MNKKLKVFKMNSCDWWADYSLEDAKMNYLKFVCSSEEDIFDAFEPPRELTEEEMNRLIFKPDPYNEPHTEVRTFREELDKTIKEGQTKPFFFASTEY